MKKCPSCDEDIQGAAIKCRYCGSPITEVLPTLAIVAVETSGGQEVQPSAESVTEDHRRHFHNITESDARLMRDGEIVELDADGRVSARATEVLGQKGVKIVQREPKLRDVALPHALDLPLNEKRPSKPASAHEPGDAPETERRGFVLWPRGKQEWGSVALNVFTLVGGVFTFVAIGWVKMLGHEGNPLPYIVVFVVWVGYLLVRAIVRFIRKHRPRELTVSSSPSGVTRQSTRELKAPMTVTGDDVQNRGRTQTDDASLGRLRVSATDRQAEAIASKRAWTVALSALGVVAALNVAFFAWSMMDFAEQGDRHEREPPASTENPPKDIYADLINDRREGPAHVLPVAVVTIEALLAEYRENEFAAAAKYENAESRRRDCEVVIQPAGCRVIELAGTIRDMGRNEYGFGYITLAYAERVPLVNAYFDEAEHESLQTLRRGQRVSVRCLVHYSTTDMRSQGLSLTRCGLAP